MLLMHWLVLILLHCTTLHYTQPRTLIENNFIHHLGVHEKQSSCWFQAKTAETTLRGNICFDIPRAGFNLNDGCAHVYHSYNNQALF